MKTFISEINEWCDMDESDLEDRLCEILDDYCEALSKMDGMTRPVNDDDILEDRDSVLFMWSDKATTLIEEKINEVHNIAATYFNEQEMLQVDISTNWYKEV